MTLKAFTFKNWSFRLLIYRIILEIYFTILNFNKPVVFNIGKKDEQAIDWSYTIFEILIFITFVLGILFIIISIVKKEVKDYKFYIALIGHSIFLLFSILQLFL